MVDREAAAFVEALAGGASPPEALARVLRGRPATEQLAAASHLLAQLKRAGVVGNRRLRPPQERIESITVNVTNRCNLRCSFCYNAPRTPGRAELPAETLVQALDGIRRAIAPGALLALLGGEPLLEKAKTLALAGWARRRGLSAIVSTNGLLVDDGFADQAAEVGLTCQVSVDGAAAASHEAVRGAGTFERALQGARTLVAAGAHTVLSMVCHAGNWREVPDFLRMAREMGAQEARFIPLKRIAGGAGLDGADILRLTELVLATTTGEPELAELLGRDAISILARTCGACARRQGCGAASQTFLLDADGTVYPCTNLAGAEFAAGNVAEQALGRILRSSVLADVRRRVSLPARSQCQQCIVRYWCMGVCRGETYDRTGDLSGRSVTCETNRATILQMLWTLSERPEVARTGGGHHVG